MNYFSFFSTVKNDSHKLFSVYTAVCFSTGNTYESRSEKTGLPGFRPGPTQTGLYNHTRWLQAGNFGVRK